MTLQTVETVWYGLISCAIHAVTRQLQISVVSLHRKNYILLNALTSHKWTETLVFVTSPISTCCRQQSTKTVSEVNISLLQEHSRWHAQSTSALFHCKTVFLRCKIINQRRDEEVALFADYAAFSLQIHKETAPRELATHWIFTSCQAYRVTS